MKSQICKIGKKLYDKGFVPGTSGNISCKYDDKILVTPSGSCLGEIMEHDIITTDLEGNSSNGIKRPSSERFMHVEIYKRRPEITCIIHAHPPKTTALAVSGKDLNTPLIAEAVVSLGPIANVQYETPSSNELATLVADQFIDHDVALMANHGATICAKSLDEAFYKMETLEFLSEIFIITDLLDKKNEIPSEKIPALLKLKK